jgi:hypothetical protein
MTEHIILLHGLWMRGFALGMLHRRLIEEGFRVHRFDYMSVAATQQHILARLQCTHDRIGRGAGASGRAQSWRSAGLARLSGWRAAAGPHRLPRFAAEGQFGGAWLRRWGRGSEVLLGHNRDLLEQGFDAWSGPREVGMMAGRMPIGLGAMLSHIEGEHDGTVAVDETRLPGLTGHCVVETSHTGLLFSPTWHSAYRPNSCAKAASIERHRKSSATGHGLKPDLPSHPSE